MLFKALFNLYDTPFSLFLGFWLFLGVIFRVVWLRVNSPFVLILFYCYWLMYCLDECFTFCSRSWVSRRAKAKGYLVRFRQGVKWRESTAFVVILCELSPILCPLYSVSLVRWYIISVSFPAVFELQITVIYYVY